MAGAGHHEQIGNRLTFFPPFVNERFDGPPFWACTYTALLNGANVGWLGQKPATHAEVSALAGASGDSDTRGGSRSSHMVQAVRTRYKESVEIERCSGAEAQRRLANGYSLVAGVTFGELPQRYRRWSPKFKLGHRVTLIGWSAGRTRILDPLAAAGPDYSGEWIAWSDFAKAWWSAEQLWFQEGQFLSAEARAQAAGEKAVMGAKSVSTVPARTLRPFDPARNFRVAANTTVVGFAPGQPPTAVRKMRFPHASGAKFDAIVAFEPGVTLDDPTKTYLQVTNGAFAGRYIPLATAGLSADIRIDQAPATTTTTTVTTDSGALAAATLDGRRQEWDRIQAATAGIVNLPPRP